MIDLTPIDVRKKKGDFRRGMRGYEAAAVDEFLDLVAERMEEIVKQNVSLSDRVGRLEEAIAEYKEREKALTDALVTAQEVREEVRRQSEKAAELVKREAQADAERIRNDAMRQREQEEEMLRRVRARSQQFMDSYRRFLERELDELSVMAESLDIREGASQAAPARRPERKGDGASGKRSKSTPKAAGRWAIADEPDAAEVEAEAPEDAAGDLFELEMEDAEAGEGLDPDWLSSLKDDGK